VALKPYIYVSAFLSVLLAAMGVHSCKEEPDEAPRVVINTPRPDALVTAGDTLSLSISVSDDIKVTSLNISLLNEEQQPVVSDNISINEPEKEVLFAFVIDDLTLSSGEYVLLVTAYDAEHSSKASVALRIKEARQELLNYVLWSGQEVATLSEKFELLSSVSIDEEIKSLQVKHSERGYLLHTEGLKLQYRDAITNEKIWSSNEISSQKSIEVSAFHFDRFFTYMFDESGSVYKVDNLGRIVIEKSKWLHPVLYTDERLNEVLSFGSENMRALNKGNLEVTAVSTTIPSPKLVFSNEYGDLSIYSNFNGHAELFSSRETPFRTFKKANVLLDDLGTVVKAMAAGQSQFMLENGTLWLVQGSSVERVDGLTQGIRDFTVDRSNGELILLKDEALVRHTSNGEVMLYKNDKGYQGVTPLYNF